MFFWILPLITHIKKTHLGKIYLSEDLQVDMRAKDIFICNRTV